MSVVNNTDVYNYILTNYVQPLDNNRQTRFDSHKRSELRGLYNRIVKTNKESPLYKINMSSNDVTKFAIDLKESARKTENLISSLTVDSDDIESVFHKKIATSSEEDGVHVEYIGENDKEPSSNSFGIEVRSLATPQVNTGNYLPSSARFFEPGAYSFDLDTPSNSYEFQFNVLENDNNLDVQNRIVRLINTSDVSLVGSVIPGEGNTNAINITSKQTGLSDSEEYLFKISTSNLDSLKSLEVLGIDRVSRAASNSSFILNGNERSSLSNTFTINNDFEITLKAPTSGEARIGFKTNTDAISDSVSDLANAFNSFLTVGFKYASVGGDSQLIREMNSIYSTHSGELKTVGIIQSENGSLSVDKEALADAVTGENSQGSFKALNHFKDALLRQVQKTAINPLDYVNKVPVEYKNPGKTFSAPYAQSKYAGLLVDQSL